MDIRSFQMMYGMYDDEEDCYEEDGFEIFPEVDFDALGDLMPQVFLAACEGDVSEVQKCLMKGQSVNVANYATNYLTPLLEACREGHWEAAKLLIDFGANLEAKDNQGGTSLHQACWNRHWKVAKLLIQRGANVNAKDNNGRTPLHDALFKGFRMDNRVIIRLLAENGADFCAEDNLGRTPFQMVCKREEWELVDLFLSQGANPMQKSSKGSSALDVASYNYCYDTVWQIVRSSPLLATSVHEPARPKRKHSQL